MQPKCCCFPNGVFAKALIIIFKSLYVINNLWDTIFTFTKPPELLLIFRCALWGFNRRLHLWRVIILIINKTLFGALWEMVSQMRWTPGLITYGLKTHQTIHLDWGAVIWLDGAPLGVGLGRRTTRGRIRTCSENCVWGFCSLLHQLNKNKTQSNTRQCCRIKHYHIWMGAFRT